MDIESLSAVNATDLCGKALLLPKVALLFWAQSGSMPLEKLWEVWFLGASGVLPVDHLASKLCSKESPGENI